MPPETALLESRALRASVNGRTEALDKVKALTLLPDGVHATTQGVADYFEVSEEVIRQLVARHRAELKGNGMTVLRGSDLARFKRDTLSRYSPSYPQPRSSLGVFTRRAVLNVALLLRDSEIARRVRTYLLDAEETHRTRDEGQSRWGYVSLESLESLVTDAAAKAAVMVLEGPIGARLDAVDRRLDAHGRVICAMSDRLCRLGDDVTEIRRDIARIDVRLDQFADLLRTRLPQRRRR